MSNSQTETTQSVSIWKALGPGLLMAGAAIGVSHLVQATRAGADYGYAILWAIILACVTKYPFMEMGPRYAAATGEHLVQGYRRMGRFYFTVFSILTLCTMFIVQAAVTIVTAGLAEQFFSLGLSTLQWSGLILLFCLSLLLIGRYPWLDKSMKVIISLLTLVTILAVLVALFKFGASSLRTDAAPTYWTAGGLAFLIALMGWMPIPLDASVWHSIWVKERASQMQHKPSLKEARFDFDMGYLSAAVIGVLFFLMGVLVMYGSGISFSSNAVVFSGQLIDMYGETLGSWSRPLVAIAAFITMLSTTLAVSDAYPRVLSVIWQVHKEDGQKSHRKSWDIYRFTAPAVAAGSLGVLAFLQGSFTLLIDFATGMSFLAAPVLAWFNLRLMKQAWVPEQARIKRGYHLFALGSLWFLILFSVAYLYWKFGVIG